MDNLVASRNRWGKMTRKVASHNIPSETRNASSLIEASQNCVNSQPCSTSGTQLHNFDRGSNQNPMMIKRFVNEELPKRSNRKNMSIAVARLMGVEEDPCEEDGKKITKIPSTDTYIDLNTFYPIEEATGRPPPRREHPHEDELHRFKIEFLAFQESLRVPINNQKLNVSPESLPASNIVILRSGYRPPKSEGQNHIRDLLEGVKKRLKSEFAGNVGTDDRSLLASQIAKRAQERNESSRSFSEFPEPVSFRYDVDESHSISLARSLSAPTSFTQLLVEDRNLLTGARVKRKHENLHVAAKPSFLGKVSVLKWRLFGSKVEPIRVTEKPNPSLFFLKAEERRNKENSTEVPPTPASFRDVWNSFPVSPPDVSPGENPAFAEIAANLNDLRRQLSQLDGQDIEPEPDESEEPIINDKAELYVRDLLIASGLYHGPVNSIRSDPHDIFKPVSVSVFEKLEALVEEKSGKSDRRMLFDLLNEVLLSAKKPSGNVLMGRKLHECVWEVMFEHLNSERAFSPLDDMVAKSIGSTSWLGFGLDEVWLGKEMEWLITGDLIHEMIGDFLRF